MLQWCHSGVTGVAPRLLYLSNGSDVSMVLESTGFGVRE
jgi:hypothetical protein